MEPCNKLSTLIHDEFPFKRECVFFYVVYYVRRSMFPKKNRYDVGKKKIKRYKPLCAKKKNGLIALNLAPIFNHSIKKRRK
jgi:hypothetical protein